MAERRYVAALIDQEDDFDRSCVEVVQKAGLADDAPVRGCKVIRPYGYGLWELMVARLDARIKATGVENAYVPVPGLSDVTAVVVTDGSSFALTADGTLFAWGANGEGELGTGETVDSTSPILVEGLTAIAQVSAAVSSVVALGRDCTV
jgi:hypothetical protein